MKQTQETREIKQMKSLQILVGNRSSKVLPRSLLEIAWRAFQS